MNQTIPSIQVYVASINVKGILCMQEGKYVDALTCFHEGLSALMEGAILPAPTPTFVVGSPISMYAQNPTIDNHYRPGMLVASPLSCVGPPETPDEGNKKLIVGIPLPEGNHSMHHDEVFSLFNRALHFRLDEENLGNNNELYCHLLTSVLTYNVGLCHHLSGLQSGDSNVLERGLDFYSMVYASLTDQKDYLKRYPASLNLCLLALTNNIGHTHAFFRRFPETRVCNDEMVYRLSLVLSVLAADSVFDEEYKVFFLNASLFSSAELLSAPAA